MPHYSYFTYNYLNYNPAVTGFTPCMELKFGYRRQWMGFQGAPNTGFANVHGKFGQKKYNYHGIGMLVENDNAGPFATTSINLNYAYHMRLARQYMLASGIGLGFSQYRLDYGKITLEDQSSNSDPLNASVSTFIFPVINLGFWLYNTSHYYGFSIRNLTSPKIKGLPGSKLVRHYTFAYGKSIKISDELAFKPAVLMNYASKSRVSLEAQAIVAYKNQVSLGVGARGGNGLTFLLKLDVVRYITFAYAYDLTMSKMRNPGASTHEITIGLRACAEKGKLHVPCAAYD